MLWASFTKNKKNNTESASELVKLSLVVKFSEKTKIKVSNVSKSVVCVCVCESKKRLQSFPKRLSQLNFRDHNSIVRSKFALEKKS